MQEILKVFWSIFSNLAWGWGLVSSPRKEVVFSVKRSFSFTYFWVSLYVYTFICKKKKPHERKSLTLDIKTMPPCVNYHAAYHALSLHPAKQETPTPSGHHQTFNLHHRDLPLQPPPCSSAPAIMNPSSTTPARRTATTAVPLPPSWVVGSYHYLTLLRHRKPPPEPCHRHQTPLPNPPYEAIVITLHHESHPEPLPTFQRTPPRCRRHRRCRRQRLPSSSSATPSLRNNTCIAFTVPCVFQTLDGSWLVGVLFAPHMFEPAPTLFTISKMSLIISWVLVSRDTSCTPIN